MKNSTFIDRIRTPRQFIPWIMKGGLAILDQGVFAGSNFVVSILLARWLPTDQYGMYAVAFAVFLFLVNFHQALLLEPMLVFGSSVYRDCLRGYLKALLGLHVAFSLVLVIALGLWAAVAHQMDPANGLPGALIGVAFAAPSILLFWLAKRTFYLKLSPGPSVASAFLYCVLTIGGLALIFKNGLLSTMSALLLMGFAGFVSSAVLLVYLWLKLPATSHPPGLTDTWRRHWRYGRWALGANAMMWIPLNLSYPLLSRFASMAQAGELKALMNFAAPMLQTCAALSSLMIPYSARVLSEKGNWGVDSVLKRMTFLCVACAVPYWSVLLMFQGPAFRMLYSGQYSEVAYLLPVIGLASVFGSAFFGPAIVLRALESPRSVFSAVCFSSMISLAVGVPLIRAYGVTGAVWTIALSEAAAFVAAVILLRRKARKSTQEAPAGLVLSASE